ncbi:hypothetical protein J8F10_01420 [Gemmata sp. G18]|uniref:Uncharacterized protein n=1 Tax=Gemmata palustris TaxID=2822762 RepID=A0ABS5BJS8_9BACT|nr:hypothetical protein [Gemmata palustris]MBP3953962.1 hypothetical protein [Gemmata palustris]
MIEILILIRLSKSIAAKAREKGRGGAPFVFLLLALWLGGEVFGTVIGMIISLAVLGDEEPNLLVMYPPAILGAIVGAVVAFQIVKAIAPAHTGDYDDYERDDRDERRGRSDRREHDDYDRDERRDRDRDRY